MDPIYLDLAKDSFLSALVFPFTGELVLGLMIMMQAYPAWLIVSIGVAVSMAAFAINWLIGKLIIQEPMISNEMRDGYAKISRFMHKYVFWLGLFCWIDVYGPFFPLFLGFFRVGFKRVMICCLIGKTLYYLYAITQGGASLQL